MGSKEFCKWRDENTAWRNLGCLDNEQVSGAPSNWDSSKGIAKAILHDRGMRRKWMARWLMATIAWFAVGLWVIDEWLGDSAVRFLVWWGLCALLALVLMIFALYDSIAVVREERNRR